MFTRPIRPDRWLVSVLFGLLAIGFGSIAWETLSNLWNAQADSPDSTYLWAGFPLAALALAATARLASLAGGRMHVPLVAVAVASLVVALVAGLIGIAVVDTSHWILVAATLVLAVLLCGPAIASRLRPPAGGTRPAVP